MDASGGQLIISGALPHTVKNDPEERAPMS
ncbi:uncharacterized protein FRV6_06456 [Fusarium oxysporum]|uniref:Uncharacterized protein n=1 Tax=Fusarium oxysporum TaxID=5507 RepID=A0A2H3TKC9_FUSOX|nr:uncharacterized protein FRV6_06456 [Fusarium oxysporum]